MLANLLPGVREIRAPLSAGYVWLLALYLIFEPLVPGEKRATGLEKALNHLGHVISSIGLGIAISFIAYVLGVLSEALLGRTFRGLIRACAASLEKKRWDDDRALRRFVSSWSEESVDFNHNVSRAQQARLVDFVLEALDSLADAVRKRGSTVLEVLRLLSAQRGEPLVTAGTVQMLRLPSKAPTREGSRPGAGDPDASDDLTQALRRLGNMPLIVLASETHPPEPNERFGPTPDLEQRFLRGYCDDLVNEILREELRLMRTRLVGKEPDLFSEVDRLQSESEFRLALVPALFALTLALALTSPHWPAAVTIIAAIVVGLSGYGRERRANDALLDALWLNRVAAPALERVDDAIMRLRDAEPGLRPPGQGRRVSSTGSVPHTTSGRIDE